MGAFSEGFRMGGDMYDQMERGKLAKEEAAIRKAAAERAATDFENQQADRARAKGIEAQVDALGQQLTRPNAGNYSMSTGTGPGMRMPEAPTPQATPEPTQVDVSAPIALNAPTPQASGPGLRMQGVSDPGMKAPALAAPMGGYTANSAPTRGAAEDVLGQIAALKGDYNGVRAAQANKRNFETEDLFAAKLKEYTGSEDQVAATAQYLNKNSKSVTMGLPDKNGLVRISVVTPDGNAQFMKLSKQDQARLYAAGHLMEVDPMKALDMMAGVNKELASAVAAENGLVSQVAGNTNDVSAKSASITHSKNALGLQASEIQARKDEAKAKAEAAVAIYVEKNPKATAAEKEAVRRGVIAAVPTLDNNAPAEVKLAAAYRRAGLAKDDAEALRMATQSKADSPEKMRAEIYGKALTANMGNAEAAKKATEEAMSYLMPKPATVAKPKDQSEAHLQASAAINGGASKDAVNARLKEFGFQPLP